MTDAHMFADWPAVTLAEHEAAYHPGRPCPEDEQGRCAARFPRPVPSPEDRMAAARTDTPPTTDPAPTHPGRSFRTWMSDTDRDQLDARAATAEQERDDARDDRDHWRRELDKLHEAYARATTEREQARAEAANLRQQLDRANTGRQKLQEQLDTQTAVAQGNKRHVAYLTAVIEAIANVEPHIHNGDTTEDNCSPYCPGCRIRTAMNTTIDVPPPGLGSPAARAQEPQPGQFCAKHFSWLCQAGQGRCQAEARP